MNKQPSQTDGVDWFGVRWKSTLFGTWIYLRDDRKADHNTPPPVWLFGTEAEATSVADLLLGDEKIGTISYIEVVPWSHEHAKLAAGEYTPPTPRTKREPWDRHPLSYLQQLLSELKRLHLVEMQYNRRQDAAYRSKLATRQRELHDSYSRPLFQVLQLSELSGLRVDDDGVVYRVVDDPTATVRRNPLRWEVKNDGDKIVMSGRSLGQFLNCESCGGFIEPGDLYVTIDGEEGFHHPNCVAVEAEPFVVPAGAEVPCNECGLAIGKLGPRVVVNQRNAETIYYHPHCYEEVMS